MPLEAVVGGLPVAAADFTAANWDVLQALIRDNQVTVELPYCGCRGHGAVSVIGTQYFKHYSDSTDCEYATAGESAEHLFAKQQIAAGIRAAGWTATIEQSHTPGADSRWRADVMATRDGHRTAFEVKLSQQTAAKGRVKDEPGTEFVQDGKQHLDVALEQGVLGLEHGDRLHRVGRLSRSPGPVVCGAMRCASNSLTSWLNR